MCGKLAGYRTSRDYAALYRLSADASHVCIVDYKGRYEVYRDVAQTIAAGEDRNVSSRGVTWVAADSEEEFAQQCAAVNLEWIVPCKNPDAQGLRKYLVERDNFEADKSPSLLLFPCIGCYHRDQPRRAEPCRTCGYNAGAVRDEPDRPDITSPEEIATIQRLPEVLRLLAEWHRNEQGIHAAVGAHDDARRHAQRASELDRWAMGVEAEQEVDDIGPGWDSR